MSADTPATVPVTSRPHAAVRFCAQARLFDRGTRVATVFFMLVAALSRILSRSPRARSVVLSVVLVLAPCVVCAAWEAACSGQPTPPPFGSGAPIADVVSPPDGVDDRGLDPAVLAITVDDVVSCAGALVAPDVVLTACRCVRGAAPAALRFRLGDDAASAPERARGRELVGLASLPDEPCASDIALVLLDRPIDGVQPLAVRTTGAAQGDHVRAVGFDRVSGGLKRVRDHLSIVDTSPTELRIAENTSPGEPSGGPALDETTGEILGIGSGAVGPDAIRTYARADVALDLVSRALAASFSAGTRPSRIGVLKAKKGPSDMGANCARGVDCAAGVCVSQATHEYCSRACDPLDRCPTRFRCVKSQSGTPVCVES